MIGYGRYMLLLYVILLLMVILTFSVGCSPQKGNTGDNGAPGQSVTGPQGPETPVLSAPATLQQCPTGGVVLSIGNTTNVICNGDVGPIGLTGPQGSPGVDATPITVVQFCPGVNPLYPNSFPEIGLCLAGQLYGVYSTNGGFLVLLTEGTYSSNGINASCTFTIGPNCSVTP